MGFKSLGGLISQGAFINCLWWESKLLQLASPATGFQGLNGICLYYNGFVWVSHVYKACRSPTRLFTIDRTYSFQRT